MSQGLGNRVWGLNSFKDYIGEYILGLGSEHLKGECFLVMTSLLPWVLPPHGNSLEQG